MKIHYRRIVKDRETKEDKVILHEIRKSDVQCVYKDRNGVFLSLTSGILIKTDHTYEEMTNAFLGDWTVYERD